MQVAVARMEDVGDPQPVSIAHPGDLREHRRQLRSRDHSIDHVVGANPAHRPESTLPASPEQIALASPAAILTLWRCLPWRWPQWRLPARRPPQPGHRPLPAGPRPRLRDTQRGLTPLPPGSQVGPSSRSPRGDALADDIRDRGTCIVHTIEHRRDRADILWQRDQTYGDLGRNTEGALGADEGPRQIVTWKVQCLSPEPNHLAIGRNDLQAENVVGRDAVKEGVGTASVLADVAADRTGLLAEGSGTK